MDGMVPAMPGLCGPGRLPAARGRAVALRVEPPGYRRLAPDGLPSLTQHDQAGDAGRNTRRPFPVPGDRWPRFLHAARERGPLGELTGLQVAALRSARCGAGQIATPVTRHARSRAAEDRVQRSARSGSTAAPFAALGVTSAAEAPPLVIVRSAALQPLRQASWHIGRDAAPPVGRRQPVRQSSHRAPPTAPPSRVRGTCGGIFIAVGRETGSLLRLRRTPPIPNPFP